MVQFQKDSFTITVSDTEPFVGLMLLKKSLSDALCLIYADIDSTPNPDTIFKLAQFLSCLSEVEKKQNYKIDQFVQEL